MENELTQFNKFSEKNEWIQISQLNRVDRYTGLVVAHVTTTSSRRLTTLHGRHPRDANMTGVAPSGRGHIAKCQLGQTDGAAICQGRGGGAPDTSGEAGILVPVNPPGRCRV